MHDAPLLLDAKLREIRALGGECDLVEECGSERARAAEYAEHGACFLDHLVACLKLAETMRNRSEGGSIVSLLCDRGERYAETIFNPAWRAAQGLDVDPAISALRDTTAFPAKAEAGSLRAT